VIPDVDEVLKKLLIQEIQIKGNEVDIKFDTPRREWSSRLSKPTINFFLFDVRLNLRLRGAEQFKTINHPDGTSEVRRNPVRVDLRYLMTAWVKEPEDEHLLLASAITGLLRHPFLPDKLLTKGLKDQPAPMPLEVATFPPEAGPVDKYSEIWGVLDNEMRPGILVTVTVSFDPYKPMLFKQVRSRDIQFYQDNAIKQPDAPASTRTKSKKYRSVAGMIKSEKYAPTSLSMTLVETNKPVEISEEGEFALQKIAEGEYHIDILLNKKVLKRHKLVVPANDYDIQL
jgi:hypothetical protein